MKTVIRAITPILIWMLAVPAFSQEKPADAISSGHIGQIDFAASSSPYAVKNITVEMSSAHLMSARAETSKLLTASNETTIITSDEASVIAQSAIEAQTMNKDEPNLFIVPIGYGVNAKNPFFNQKNGFNVAMRKFRDHTVKSVRDDKIGFVVVTFSLGLETVRWIHASHLTTIEKSAVVTYGIISAMIFSLNKDTWTHITKPVQRKIRSLLRMSTAIPTKPGAADIVVKLAANFLISSAVALGRVPLINMDEIANRSLATSQVTTPLLISFIGSMTGMAWGELVTSINQKTQPRAKFVTRRLLEARSLILGMFASTAMLLTYDVYGIQPWITMGVIGSIGVALYFNSAKFVHWIETNPVLGKMHISTAKHPSAPKGKAVKAAPVVPFKTSAARTSLSCQQVIDRKAL